MLDYGIERVKLTALPIKLPIDRKTLMAETQSALRPFGHVAENPILLEHSVTAPVCEIGRAHV